MENFILYEEIGKGNNSIVYKGRRKGTINFLAILCIEKCKRASITNWVRLTHEIDHNRIVKFYEWYETSNHLWMVVELCTGGTLAQVLQLDHCLPEEIVREFGKDIAFGIHHLHQLGIVFSNLCPHRILLDGPGILKLTNFGLARLEGENLSEVYEQAMAQHHDNSEMETAKMENMEYIAPEVLKEGEPSISSDLWSFGVLLYHMHAGLTPFGGKNHAEIVQQVCHSNFSSTDVMRKKNFSLEHIPATLRNEKPSSDFSNLLSGLLKKNPQERLSWDDVIKHPFWKGSLIHLGSIDKSIIASSISHSFKDSIDVMKSQSEPQRESQIFNSSAEDGSQRLSTAPKRVDVMDNTFTLSSRPHTALPCSPEKRMGTPSPEKSAPVLGSTFTLEGKKLLLSQGAGKSSSATTDKQKPQEKSAKKSLRKKMMEVRQNSQSSEVIALEDVKDLIYHASDMELSVIQDNPQIIRVDPLLWDAKSLPFHPLTSVDGVTPDELYNHMQDIMFCLNQNQISAKAKVTAVTYLAHLCSRSSAVANFTVNSQLIKILASLSKQSSQPQPDVGLRAARAIGLASCCATELEYGSKITEIFSALSDAIRENFRNQRVKLALLPALGQLLFLVAEQEEGNLCNTAEEDKKGNWGVPSSTYMLINRCLREGEDPVIQHIACKTIENVSTKTGSHRKRFLSSSQSQQGAEVIGTLLWTIANRAASESLKKSAMSALCRLNCISGNGSVFQGVLDKVGLPGVLSTLAKSNAHCVQSLITMFVENLHSASKGQASRLAAAKELLPSLMKFLDIPSTVVRAKVFLAVLVLIRRAAETLLAACNNRLIMYIERDSRKATSRILGPGNLANANPYSTDASVLQTYPPNYEYMQSALNLLVRHIVMQCPPIMGACVSILEETSGRKHPSGNHVKQLKVCLPTCTIIMHTVTSQIFQSLIVTSDFITNLGCLLSHATKFLQQQSSTSGVLSAIGDEIVQQFIDSVLSIVESLSQQPHIITQHEEATMLSLVPQLIVLLGVYNQNGKAVCVKLLDDLLGTILHHRAVTQEEQEHTSIQKSATKTAWTSKAVTHDEKDLCNIVAGNLLPEYQPILLGRDPLPAYGARLLSTLLEHWPTLATTVKESDLLPVIMQVFSEHMTCVLGSCAQGVVSLLILLLSTRDLSIVNELYDGGVIDLVNSYLLEVSCLYMEAQELGDTNNASIATESLTNLLILLKEMLNLVTGEVKKALQMKDGTGTEKESATENAERLLVINKPLTELQGICVRMLCEDREIADLALSNFSMLVQLYGGDHPDTMADENLECLVEALEKAQPKQQKVLLKIIKRVISLNEYHAEHVRGNDSSDGSVLLVALKRLATDAGERADLVIAELAQDIVSTVESGGSIG